VSGARVLIRALYHVTKGIQTVPEEKAPPKLINVKPWIENLPENVLFRCTAGHEIAKHDIGYNSLLDKVKDNNFGCNECESKLKFHENWSYVKREGFLGLLVSIFVFGIGFLFFRLLISLISNDMIETLLLVIYLVVVFLFSIAVIMAPSFEYKIENNKIYLIEMSEVKFELEIARIEYFVLFQIYQDPRSRPSTVIEAEDPIRAKPGDLLTIVYQNGSERNSRFLFSIDKENEKALLSLVYELYDRWLIIYPPPIKFARIKYEKDSLIDQIRYYEYSISDKIALVLLFVFLLMVLIVWT
jgi:hypothetical protein